VQVDPFSVFAAGQPNRRPQDLEDDLNSRPASTDSDADTSPNSSQTDDQCRRMGSQGSAARLRREEHQRNQGCQREQTAATKGTF